MTGDKQLGQRIRSLRLKKNRTQEQISELAGLSSKYFSELERGNETISMKNLNKIAAVLEVPLADLISAEHEAPRKDLEKEVQKMINEADDEQLKTIYRILTAVVR
jgi:transcriptional regulator with XRE-family HTH domain